MEILTDPSIIFLDEPTIGLDTTDALRVMQVLNLLARNKRTIICSIHQPRSDIFQSFDSLLLLSEGLLIYLGKASEAKDNFEANGYLCPSGYDPADFLVDFLVSIPETNMRQERVSCGWSIWLINSTILGNCHQLLHEIYFFLIGKARFFVSPPVVVVVMLIKTHGVKCGYCYVGQRNYW